MAADHTGWMRRLPGLQTLRGYQVAWLHHDIVAGLPSASGDSCRPGVVASMVPVVAATGAKPTPTDRGIRPWPLPAPYPARAPLRPQLADLTGKPWSVPGFRAGSHPRPAPAPGTGLRHRHLRVHVRGLHRAGQGGAAVRAARAATRGSFQPGGVQFGDPALARAPLPATPENLALAVRFVAGLRADGGTEMAAALRARTVLDGKTRSERLRQVVSLPTGASATSASCRIIGRDLDDARSSPSASARPPTATSWRRRQPGARTFTYIGAVNEVDERMRDLLSKLESIRSWRTSGWPTGRTGRRRGASADPDPRLALRLRPGRADYVAQAAARPYVQGPLVVSFHVIPVRTARQELAVAAA